jgi:glycogen phosphorylase
VIKALRTFRVRPTLPPELATLAKLAGNLRWAWEPGLQELFRWADPDLYEAVRGNPVALLGKLAPERLAALAQDATFVARVAAAEQALDGYLTEARWAQGQDPAPPRVAYFSPEFGITGAMQTYSGGLGVLAGDHLKASSDLGLDLVGVGLLYRHGYFRQFLDADGWQQERYPDLNPHNLPLRRLERDGAPATFSVRVAEHDVACQVWLARVGRVPLLLVDTDLPENAPEDRVITDKLYGGDIEHRLRQEIVLGIGGIRALDIARSEGTLRWAPQVYHSNEGHAAFLQLERIRALVEDEGLSFDEAVESARSAVLFTTHTPVPAGIDVFPRELVERYFGAFAGACGIDMGRLLALGQPLEEHGAGPAFNMAIMALRLSAAANGVSQLHGHVARTMFAFLWPGVPVEEVPIGHVTNGVHGATWIGPEMRANYDRRLVPDWTHNPGAWARVGELSDDALWQARGRARERLVGNLRQWVRAQAARRGESAATTDWADTLFDPQALTIGFARRFAEYKRGTLLLSQPDRLRALLGSGERPVQLVFAGKAHPRDDIGKNIIRELVHFAQSDPVVRARLVFIEDYDIDLAAVLYQGVDVWLNNPRRPFEACGTSGQKAVLNGALHCSVLDGWWDEMYEGDNGFAIGAPRDGLDSAQQDAADAQSLFDLLEHTIVPLFYDRDESNVPRRWTAMVRRSLTSLAPRVLASRMVRQYATELYTPVAAHAARLTADGHARARELAAWKRHLAGAWGEVAVEALSGSHEVAELGEKRTVEATVRLGVLRPDDVRVELLHGEVRADGTIIDAATQLLACTGEDAGGRYHYAGAFPCRLSGEYGVTVRVVPAHPDLYHWTEPALVTWGNGTAEAPAFAEAHA